MSEKVYGLMAEFDSPAAILHAAEKVRDAGYRRWDAFTPFPIHGMDQVMKLGNSLVGWVALAGGAFMFLNVVGLIWFANAFDYPLIVGGKPMFSVPMTFVPASARRDSALLRSALPASPTFSVSRRLCNTSTFDRPHARARRNCCCRRSIAPCAWARTRQASS